jgi:hypothetical protein
MKRYTQSELAEVVRLHGRWLRSEAGGVRADLSGSDLSGSNLSGSNLSGSNLTYSNLTCSNLSGSNLRGCNLSGSNLSGCTNLLSQQAFMQDNFTHDRRGFIVYKTFNSQYTAPAAWVIKPGSIIEEVCNPDRCNDCGSGVNGATIEWVKRNSSGTIWKCRIAWKDAPGIVVPYMTDGKIRTERVELIEVVGAERAPFAIIEAAFIGETCATPSPPESR